MSERLTDEQLRELDERLRRAGPYEAIRVSSEEMEAICRGNAMFPNLTDELIALRARVAKLEVALKDIAKQRIYAEMDEQEHRHADFEGAYEIMIKVARAALKDAPQ